ncbi:MAG: hypothetical protein KAR20_24510 [Candidatus Heimdallarchaeota archaeon]|nr:hypothetical protein [Candidatus Heimdallarchaeota archaeon]
MAYDNTNSGALFKNDRKTSPNQPDYKGNAEIQCPHCGKNSEFWLSAWIKIARASKAKFFSFAYTAKDADGPKTGKSDTAKTHKEPESTDDGFDDIPF